jgi:hypothetical protein
MNQCASGIFTMNLVQAATVPLIAFDAGDSYFS